MVTLITLGEEGRRKGRTTLHGNNDREEIILGGKEELKVVVFLNKRIKFAR